MKLHVRPATQEDHLLYLRLLPELGVDDPPPDAAQWAELVPQTLVAERGGEAVGVCTWVKLEGSGHVRTLIVDPRARRTGAGRALLVVVAQKLSAAGCTSWALNVKPENVAAVTLYTSLGFRRQYAAVQLRMPWSVVPSLPPSSSAVHARAVTPEDDRALEQLFSLPAGKVEGLRRSKRVLLTVVDETGAVAALSAYNPSYPGAFPFRVKTPTMARSLLEAMAPHALAGAEWTGLVVENDEALVALLQSCGATVRMHIDHYVGSLSQ